MTEGEIKQLEEERDRVARSCPEGIKLQNELNIALSGVKDPSLRIMLIMKKISQGQKIISDACKQINQIVGGVKK